MRKLALEWIRESGGQLARGWRHFSNFHIARPLPQRLASSRLQPFEEITLRRLVMRLAPCPGVGSSSSIIIITISLISFDPSRLAPRQNCFNWHLGHRYSLPARCKLPSGEAKSTASAPIGSPTCRRPHCRRPELNLAHRRQTTVVGTVDGMFTARRPRQNKLPPTSASARLALPLRGARVEADKTTTTTTTGRFEIWVERRPTTSSSSPN